MSCGWPEDAVLNDTFATQDWLKSDNYFYIICYPILLFICTVGNIASLRVVLTEKVKTTTSLFLSVVSIADLGVLWFYLVIYAPDVDMLYLRNNEEPDEHYYRSAGFFIWLQATCTQISDWTLIVFSFERLLVICFPLRFKDGYGIRKARYLILVIVFLAMVFHLENMVTQYYAYYNQVRAANLPASIVKWRAIQKEAEVSMTIGKWLLLTVFNFCIALMIVRRLKAFGTDKAARRQKTRYSNSLLLASALLYFVTQAPNVILSCLHIASTPPYCTYNLKAETDLVATPIINIILLCNYSLNFVVYFVATTKFRARVKEQLHYLKWGRRKKLLETSKPPIMNTVESSAYLESGV